MRSIHLIALLIVLAGLPVRALAWSDEGHKAIGKLAWQLVAADDPAAAQWWLETLADLPQPPGKAILRSPVGAAIWPDDIRGSFMDHPTWHYRDIGITFDGAHIPTEFEPPSPGAAPDEHALSILLRLANDDLPADLLGCGCATREEREAARLAWIEHLVGDMHQPLHAASLVGSGYSRLGDQGGNLFWAALPASLSPLGAVKLHKYWDDMFRLHGIGDGNNIAPLVDRVWPELDKAVPQFPIDSQQQELTITGWLMQSHDLASSAVYAPLLANQSAGKSYAVLPDEAHAATMTVEYWDASLVVARQRVGEASRALASIVEYCYQQRVAGT